MLHNICMSAVAICHSGERTVARGPLVFFFFLFFFFISTKNIVLSNVFHKNLL